MSKKVYEEKASPKESPKVYYFSWKDTGLYHFHVESTPDGRFPVEEAAGILAMNCMVRGVLPEDYKVMVEAKPEFLSGLNEAATKLLRVGLSTESEIKLTRRETEVLGGVMRSQANKEIAGDLHLSERTVKFHVSALLTKFHVSGRMQLVARAMQTHSNGNGGRLMLAAS